MSELRRVSPVRFKANPLKSEMRGNWTVVLEYNEENGGPCLVDLSHKTRWDLQDGEIGRLTVNEFAMPETVGKCTFTGQTLINRMNGTQVSIYHLGSQALSMPDFIGYTDVSESTVFLALFGPNAFHVAERLTNLDFMDPAKAVPFLLQGPICQVPCQIVVLEKHSDGSGGFLMTCSRGYGDSMVEALLKAGADFGLRPAGENRFNEWIKVIQKKFATA